MPAVGITAGASLFLFVGCWVVVHQAAAPVLPSLQLEEQGRANLRLKKRGLRE